MPKTGEEIYKVFRPSPYGGESLTQEMISGKLLVEEIEEKIISESKQTFSIKDSENFLTNLALHFTPINSTDDKATIRNDPIAFIKALEYYLEKECPLLVPKGRSLAVDVGKIMLEKMQEYLNTLKTSPSLKNGFTTETKVAEKRIQAKILSKKEKIKEKTTKKEKPKSSRTKKI